MCNLYSLTKGQAAIRDWFRASNDRTGNLPPFPGIFPDQMAPIVRNGADGARELVMARWGMPGPRRCHHQYPKCRQSTLAGLAWQAKPGVG
jgi:putative SOS response-associated peptidase YedK